MSNDIALMPGPLRVPALPWARWLVLGTLLLIESTLLALQCGTAARAGQGAAAAFIIAHRYALMRLGIGTAAATALFLAHRLGRDWRHSSRPQALGHRWPAVFAGHLAAFGATAALLPLVMGGDRLPPVLAWGASSLAALAGVAALACLAALVLPPADWLRLLRLGWPALIGGLAVGVAAWLAGWGTGHLWRPLSQGTFWLVYRLLALVRVDAFCDPAKLEVGTSDFAVVIADACSGYQGIGLICILLATYLWLFRQRLRFPQALVLLPVGMAVIWLSNAVRIVVLILIGTLASPRVAVEGFHSYAGWLAFNAIGLGMVVVSQRSEWLSRTPRGAAAYSNPAAAYLAPFLAVVATGMCLGAAGADPEVAYAGRIVAGVVVLWWYRRSYGAPQWDWSWACLAAGAAVAALWAALDIAMPPSANAPALTDPAGKTATWVAAALACRLLGYVVVMPLAEELAFRGFLLRRLVASDFEAVPAGRLSWPVVVVSSAAFGVMHSRWLAGALAGIVFALIFRRRGRLSDCVVAHTTANGLLAVAALVTERWSLWS